MLRELFGPSKPQPKSQPQTQQPKPAAPTPPPRPDSVLGANTHLTGTLRAEGNVRIDGTFIGNVSTQGRILIGEQGQLEGDLVGDAVDVAGVVKGDIIARKVSVMRTGRVWGDLCLEKLMTEEGAFVQGLVTMEESVNIADHLPARPQPDETPAEEKKEEPAAEAQPEKVKVVAAKGKG